MPVFIGQPAHGLTAFELVPVFHRRQRMGVHGQPVLPVAVSRQRGLKHLQLLRLVAQHHAAAGGQGFHRQFAEALQWMIIQTQDGQGVSRCQARDYQDEPSGSKGDDQLLPPHSGLRMFELLNHLQCKQQEIARERTRGQSVQIVECQHRQRNAELVLHNLSRPGDRVKCQPQPSQQQQGAQDPINPEHDIVFFPFVISALSAEPHQTR